MRYISLDEYKNIASESRFRPLVSKGFKSGILLAENDDLEHALDRAGISMRDKKRYRFDQNHGVILVKQILTPPTRDKRNGERRQLNIRMRVDLIKFLEDKARKNCRSVSAEIHDMIEREYQHGKSKLPKRQKRSHG